MPGAILEIVEQHAEEAAFLWLLRNEATHAPDYDLDDLAELDERVDAHLDGLRVAGRVGWDVCREALAWREPGEVFAAAHVALQNGTKRRVTQVLDVATESVELARGFVSALGWFPYPDVQSCVESLAASRDAIARRIGIAGAAVHRRDLGGRLDRAVAKDQPTVRPRALKAAAELGRHDLLPHCREGTGGQTPDAGYWSAWSAALLGDPTATMTLWQIAANGGSHAEPACELAVRSSGRADGLEWQQKLATIPGRARIAIAAARGLGDPGLAPWLIDAMSVTELARPAGEAFTFITGVDLESAKLSRRHPDGFHTGPTDDPNDDDVAMDPDEDLAWPEPEAIGRWWSAHRGRFVSGERYLMGKPIRPDALRVILREGTQRQRAAAAVELVLLRPGQPLFEVRAPAEQQRRMLSS